MDNRSNLHPLQWKFEGIDWRIDLLPVASCSFSQLSAYPLVEQSRLELVSLYNLHTHIYITIIPPFDILKADPHSGLQSINRVVVLRIIIISLAQHIMDILWYIHIARMMGRHCKYINKLYSFDKCPRLLCAKTEKERGKRVEENEGISATIKGKKRRTHLFGLLWRWPDPVQLVHTNSSSVGDVAVPTGVGRMPPWAFVVATALWFYPWSMKPAGERASERVAQLARLFAGS